MIMETLKKELNGLRQELYLDLVMKYRLAQRGLVTWQELLDESTYHRGVMLMIKERLQLHNMEVVEYDYSFIHDYLKNPNNHVWKTK